MKKISLKNLNLKEVEQLSREQLKDVLGGWTGGTTGGGTTGGTELPVGGPGCTFSCTCNAGTSDAFSVTLSCEGLNSLETRQACTNYCG